MSTTTALRKHRDRLAAQGVRRIEVQARVEDAALIRAVAAALADPKRAEATRAVLRARIMVAPVDYGTMSLKDLLSHAPLEGIDLERQRDLPRDIDL